MRLSDAGELNLLDAIRKRYSSPPVKNLLVGIGDDAAVILPKTKEMLLTTDMMVEGVHFDLSWVTPFQLGFKLVSVNVSDIYAMGGEPEFILLNFAAGKNRTVSFLERFLDGVQEASKKYGATLIGGDISSFEKVVVSATVIGYAHKAIKRSGARPGDRIYVSGNLGDSACGLEIMKRIGKSVEIEKGKRVKYNIEWQTVQPLIKRHLMPEARHPGEFLSKATAMMDISDGLFIDLSRLCSESQVGAEIYKEDIPISEELRKASVIIGLSSFELAVSGGEDYELLFTAPPDRNVKAMSIGRITNTGLYLVDSSGRRRKIKTKGYQHFAD